MRGGVRLTLLRATDPGRVKEGLGSLPGVHAGLPIVSLEVWADQRQIVHRLAVTFRGTEIVNTGRPVSKAATQRVKQAQRALKKLLGQYRQSGKRPPASRLNAALNRVLQAQLHAVRRRRETAVTEATLTYSGIGQPQHITPRHTIPVSELG